MPKSVCEVAETTDSDPLVDRWYVEALKGPDCHIYVPRVEAEAPRTVTSDE
jgi:hypothetical protein